MKFSSPSQLYTRSLNALSIIACYYTRFSWKSMEISSINLRNTSNREKNPDSPPSTLVTETSVTSPQRGSHILVLLLWQYLAGCYKPRLTSYNLDCWVLSSGSTAVISSYPSNPRRGCVDLLPKWRSIPLNQYLKPKICYCIFQIVVIWGYVELTLSTPLSNLRENEQLPSQI